MVFCRWASPPLQGNSVIECTEEEAGLVFVPSYTTHDNLRRLNWSREDEAFPEYQDCRSHPKSRYSDEKHSFWYHNHQHLSLLSSHPVERIWLECAHLSTFPLSSLFSLSPSLLFYVIFYHYSSLYVTFHLFYYYPLVICHCSASSLVFGGFWLVDVGRVMLA